MQKRGHGKNNKKFIIVGILLLMFFGLTFILSYGARAQEVENDVVMAGVKKIEQPLGLPATDIRLIVANIIKTALSLLGIIALIIMMYGGFLWMTSKGNEEQVGKAKKVLINGAIGLAIILSAYSVVLFVMRMLGVGISGGGDAGLLTGEAPTNQHFQGSGALGRIIKDHYPERDQTDVPRNTKIVITFAKPILASSTIDDTNKNGIFGDCISAPSFSWSNENVCDRLKTVSGKLDDKYINIKRSKTGTSIPAAVALASKGVMNGLSGVYTLVIKPLTDLTVPSGGYLGDPSEQIAYTVRIGSGIQLDDASNNYPSIFSQSWLGAHYYEWNFTCATTLDLTPPYIKGVYPAKAETVAKNTVIQVDFSEAMDPIGLQGAFIDSGSGYYNLQNGYIFSTANKSKAPVGNFILSNGYTTAEFISSKECGFNACGQKRFCLPVCDNAGSQSCAEDLYTLLLLSAQTKSTSSFEGVPFTGIMDLAGNALDSDQNNKVDKPALTNEDKPFPYSKKPDNFSWYFTVKDYIDTTAPYLRDIIPGRDAEWVTSTQDWIMVFSKRMRVSSMYNIDIIEHPTPANNEPMWYVPRVNLGDRYTTTTMKHGAFLKLTEYYPIVTSSVEDVNYNCFYPGKGPSVKADQTTKLSPVCDGAINCCLVSEGAGKDFCCNGNVNSQQGAVVSCLNYLKSQFIQP